VPCCVHEHTLETGQEIQIVVDNCHTILVRTH